VAHFSRLKTDCIVSSCKKLDWGYFPCSLSVTGLSDFYRFVKDLVRHRAHHHQRQAPLRRGREEGHRKRPLGSFLFCLLAAAVGSSGVVKELYAKGEAAFVAEASDKARVWWNQSGTRRPPR